MYLCVIGIDFVSFCDLSIGIWNCSDSVMLFYFSFWSIIRNNKRFLHYPEIGNLNLMTHFPPYISTIIIESCSETIMGRVSTTIIASSKLLIPLMVNHEKSVFFFSLKFYQNFLLKTALFYIIYILHLSG
jgi:hypothetical protein